MKKILLFGLFATATSFSNAQPTLTASNINPVIGEAFTIASSNNSISPGSAGSNQTWNLTSFGSTTLTTYSVIPVSSSPSASLFPMANIAISSSSTNFNYYNNTNSSSTFEGFVNNVGSSVYSNPQTILNLPVNFNDTYSDTWVEKFIVGTLSFTRTGVSNYTADAWGTLTTPSGTNNNVLRIKVVSTYTDNGSSSTTSYIQTDYKWFVPNTHYEIASATTISVTGGGSFYSSTYLNNAVTNIHSTNNFSPSNIILFPNPSSDEIKLNFSISEPSNIEIKIIDINNKTIKTANDFVTITGKNELKIDTRGITSGIYFIKINVNGVFYGVERFVIEN